MGFKERSRYEQRNMGMRRGAEPYAYLEVETQGAIGRTVTSGEARYKPGRVHKLESL